MQVLLRILLRFLRPDRSLKILFGGLQVVPHCDLYGIANPIASIMKTVFARQLRFLAGWSLSRLFRGVVIDFALRQQLLQSVDLGPGEVRIVLQFNEPGLTQAFQGREVRDLVAV